MPGYVGLIGPGSARACPHIRGMRSQARPRGVRKMPTTVWAPQHTPVSRNPFSRVLFISFPYQLKGRPWLCRSAFAMREVVLRQRMFMKVCTGLNARIQRPIGAHGSGCVATPWACADPPTHHITSHIGGCGCVLVCLCGCAQGLGMRLACAGVIPAWAWRGCCWMRACAGCTKTGGAQGRARWLCGWL